MASERKKHLIRLKGRREYEVSPDEYLRVGTALVTPGHGRLMLVPLGSPGVLEQRVFFAPSELIEMTICAGRRPSILNP